MSFGLNAVVFLSIFLAGGGAQATGLCRAFPNAEQISSVISENEIKMFSRGPGSIDPVYLHNMRLVASIFSDWLAREEKTVAQSYADFLSELHRTAIYDNLSGKLYWPDPNSPPEAVSELGGRFRHQLPNPLVNKLITHSTDLSLNSMLQILTRLNGREEIPGYPPEDGESLSFVNIVGLGDPGFRPYYRRKSLHIDYSYAEGDAVPVYLRLMSEEMERLKKLVHRKAGLASILRSLGRYYHLATCGHPFYRVNNSLFMAQVNVVLIAIGLKPVYHGDLDLIVRALDSGQAEAAFANYILRNQR